MSALSLNVSGGTMLKATEPLGIRVNSFQIEACHGYKKTSRVESKRSLARLLVISNAW